MRWRSEALCMAIVRTRKASIEGQNDGKLSLFQGQLRGAALLEMGSTDAVAPYTVRILVRRPIDAEVP
jgi:hypothetical protein